MTGFMHAQLQSLPLFEQVDREWERLPVHTAHHIMLALEVLGYDHPTAEVRAAAKAFYLDAVRAQHLTPESREEYEARYIDNPERVESAIS